MSEDKAPGQVAYEAWEKSRDDRIGLQPSIEAIAHAVIAHVTPKIRAAAIEDAAQAYAKWLRTVNVEKGIDGFNDWHFWGMAAIRDIAPLPPGHVCVPVEQAAPKIRAAAIEDAAKVIESECIDYAGVHADMVRAIAPLPPGHVCVPSEPTYEMVQAGAKLVKDNMPYHTGTKAIYEAMLAAAKEPK